MALFMVTAINPPLGHFNDWLYQCLESMRGGSSIVLGAVLGGMMAVDFGEMCIRDRPSASPR